MKHEAWTQALEGLRLALDPAQLAILEAYEELLRDLAIPRGLIARADADRLRSRHVADGLRAAPEIPERASVLDLGSGAGIPGIPLAVALPASRVTLVDVRRGKVAFLEAAVDRLGLTNVEVVLGRAEALGPSFDVCVARAFSSPEGTWATSEPLLKQGGRLIYWAGMDLDPATLDRIGVPWRVSTRSDLADSGPLVIMSR